MFLEVKFSIDLNRRGFVMFIIIFFYFIHLYFLTATFTDFVH